MTALASPTAVPASTLTVHPLLLGEVEVDHTFLMWASEPGARLWIPTTAYLILGAEAPILVDASFSGREYDNRALAFGCCGRSSRSPRHMPLTRRPGVRAVTRCNIRSF